LLDVDLADIHGQCEFNFKHSARTKNVHRAPQPDGENGSIRLIFVATPVMRAPNASVFLESGQQKACVQTHFSLEARGARE
jgi:hypothetical protein